MDLKGNSMKTLVNWVKHKLGEDGYRGWLESLPDDTKALYRGTIMNSMWYPIDVAYMPALDAVLALTHPDDPVQGGYEFGRFSGAEDLGGIYKVFLKMGSPGKMVTIASMMWSRFYNEGDLKVVENVEGRAVIQMVDVPVKHSPWEQTTRGWSEVAAELAGGKDVEVVVAKSFTAGDDCTEYQLAWK